MRKRTFFFLTCLFLSIGMTWAQHSIVSGIVLSEEDGEPVIGGVGIGSRYTGRYHDGYRW